MVKWWLLWSLLVASASAEVDVDVEDDVKDSDEVEENVEDKGPVIIDGFTPEELQKMRDGAETHDFQAEVSRLMDIIINSLYGSKDIFIRELLSNAGDALERARFNSVADPSYLGEQKDLRIRLEVNEAAKTLSIEDTGCGMTKQELIDNLGTVAKSGTTNFLEALKEGQGEGDASSLIGQFGVGFYSAFLVADTVIVTTVSPDEPEKQHIWQSAADGSFSVVEDPRGPTLKRGSRVTLVLKEEAAEYLNTGKLAELVKKFSQFMIHPIYQKKSESEIKQEAADEADDEEGEKDEEDEDSKQWKRLNTQHPIWMRPKEEVTEEEYHEFYKTIGKDAFDPLAYTHFVAEGDIEFRSILFIPKRPPHQMSSWGNKDEWKSEIKLFVRRVLVAEEFGDLLPTYLAWVKGVVDSDDLPLNVNREQLQQSKIMKVISKKLTRKVLEMLRKLAKNENEEEEEDEKKDEDEDDKKDSQTTYDKFYEEFKGFLNLGCYEDDASRSKLTKLLRFPSTYAEKQDNKRTSLEEYVNRMKEDQPAIYYMAGVKVKEMLREVNLEIYEKKGLEVLLLDDPLSENCFSKIYDFEGVKLRSVQKGGDLKIAFSDEENARHKDLVTMYKPLIKWWETRKVGQGGVPISKVEVSRRLVSSAAGITADEWGHSSRQERMNKAMSEQDTESASFSQNKKVLEINPDHPAIYDLLQKVKSIPAGEIEQVGVNSEEENIASLITQAAVLQSNYDLDDPEMVVNSVFDLLSLKHGLDPNVAVEQVEIEIPEPEPEKEHDDVDWDDVDDETNAEVEKEEKEKDPNTPTVEELEALLADPAAHGAEVKPIDIPDGGIPDGDL